MAGSTKASTGVEVGVGGGRVGRVPGPNQASWRHKNTKGRRPSAAPSASTGAEPSHLRPWELVSVLSQRPAGLRAASTRHDIAPSGPSSAPSQGGPDSAQQALLPLLHIAPTVRRIATACGSHWPGPGTPPATKLTEMAGVARHQGPTVSPSHLLQPIAQAR